MGFLVAGFSLLRPSVLDLGSGLGQTDDDHQRLIAHLWGLEHNKRIDGQFKSTQRDQINATDW